jgi:hypothetical protein
MARRKRGFGRIRRLSSKRYQASFVGPDLVRHPAPTTFQTRGDAEGWLAREQRLIGTGTWTPPKLRTKGVEPLRFGAYAAAWVSERPLKPRTRSSYRDLLDKHLMPTFGGMALTSIHPATVRALVGRAGQEQADHQRARVRAAANDHGHRPLGRRGHGQFPWPSGPRDR